MDLSATFRKSYPQGPTIEAGLEVALDRFGLTVLFGPSGCGKSTVLRCLAGLEQPDSGRIMAGGRVWFDAAGGIQVPAWQRKVGFVFQDAALFPHLTVQDNIGYGLRGLAWAERRRRVAELIALVGLEGLAERRPGALSGGEKQRVALARALAPRPDLVLLDEPFVSLDRAAAEQLRHALRHILRSLGVPAVLVTHDPGEALALGDRMVLMAEGRMVGAGSPAEVLSSHGQHPEGQGGAVIRARVLGRVEGLLRIEAGATQLFAPDPGGDLGPVYAWIRGEGVALECGAHGLSTQRNRLSAMVVAIEPMGALTRVHLDVGFPLQAVITTWACQDLGLVIGQRLQALIKASAIQVVAIEDEALSESAPLRYH